MTHQTRGESSNVAVPAGGGSPPSVTGCDPTDHDYHPIVLGQPREPWQPWTHLYCRKCGDFVDLATLAPIKDQGES